MPATADTSPSIKQTSGFSEGFRGVATFLIHAPECVTTLRHLARRLRVSIAQSQMIAHVLGSSAEMVARAGLAALHFA
jgi:hypothetical protein